MIIRYNHIVDAARHELTATAGPITVGRQPQCDIVLDSPYVPPQAFILHGSGGRWSIGNLGLDGLQVGEQPLPIGSTHPLPGSLEFPVYPFIFSLEVEGIAREGEGDRFHRMETEFNRWLQDIHHRLIKRLDAVDLGASQQVTRQTVQKVEAYVEELAGLQSLPPDQLKRLVNYVAGLCVRFTLLDVSQSEVAVDRDTQWQVLCTSVPQYETELEAIANDMTRRHFPVGDDTEARVEKIESGFWPTWEGYLRMVDPKFALYLTLRYTKKVVKDVLFGYGPLEDLLRLPTISEIMVVDRDRIYIEHAGVVQPSGRKFINDDVTLTIIERIVGQVNRRIDRSQPLVDARLKDGSRVNAVIPPLAVSGPCLTIRKFPSKRLHFTDLIRFGAVSQEAARFLNAAVASRRNVIVSGGTGSGKTTLLNCLSDFIGDKERVVTVEDTAELRLNKSHVVRLETRPANVEGAGSYSIADLVKNALRMRPDRIVVGECRGGEALDMLQAMNTGHDGSMTTLHANTTEDAMTRLEVLVQMGCDLPPESIRRIIASAVHLVIQLERLSSGRRLVTQISEVVGLDEEDGGLQLRHLFAYDAAAGSLLPTGSLPTFMLPLLAAGRIKLEDFFLEKEPEHG